jgi:hypothetical protein
MASQRNRTAGWARWGWGRWETAGSSRSRVIWFVAVAVFGAAGLAHADDSAKSLPPPSLDDQLAALHQEAKTARESKQFAEVERLRLERRRLIRESKASSAWTKGMTAITQAEQAVGLMQYARACQILQAAWNSFESLPPRRVVFGDLAIELFLATEAARMVDPELEHVPVATLRKALERAATDDPCQVEVEAALAFLSRPNADESFQRQNVRESIRLRNDRLLAIRRDPNAGGPILPWHAPVQYLQAKSTSFVLGDIDYLRAFLDPRTRLSGTNRHGEAWCLALGGGILGISMDRSGGEPRTVVTIDSYDLGRRAWQELRPQVLVVTAAVPDAAGDQWQLSGGWVQKRLESLLIDLEIAVKTRADQRLVAIAAEFPPEVVAAVEQIRNGTWKNGPPPGSAIDAVLGVAASGFATYAANRADKAVAATRAKQAIEQLAADVLEVSRVKQANSNAAAGTPLSDADRAALRQLVERIDFNALQPAVDSLAATGLGGGRPAGLQGPQFKAELFDVLDRAELLAALQAYATDGEGFLLVKLMRDQAQNLVTQIESVGGDVFPAQRRAVRQVRDAVDRLEGVFAKLAASPQQPLLLADFTLLRRQIDEVRYACAVLDIPDLVRLDARVRPLLALCSRVVGPVEDRARALKVAAGRSPVRTWTIGATEWKFFEFGVISASEAAAVVELLPPLVVAASDLETVSKQLVDKGASPSMPVLRPGSAKTGPLVDSSGTSQGLNVRMAPPSGPIVGIVLVEQDVGPAASGPRTLVDDKGRPMLLVDDAGTPRPLRVDLDAGHLVVDYPGLEGHVPLGISADTAARPRFMRDRRGYRISAAAPDQPRLFDIVAANGERVDGSFHSLSDLVDLDRNIVNEFLPPALLYAPSLPVWQVYREQLVRQPPDGRVRWALPRPVFRTDQ